MPSLSNTYDSLATWYLEQKLDPQRAVELSEVALELIQSKNESSDAVQKITYALALAVIGQNDRAEGLIEQALEAAEHVDTRIRADLNRQIGHARLAQGNREAAVEHFRKAIELDPDGIFGKLAHRALDSIASPS